MKYKTERISGEDLRLSSMSGESEREAEGRQETDFDSLFSLDEADKADLVAKQQQLSYIRRDGAGGSGAGSPARGSPARRIQVRCCRVLQKC